jgi:hypothetical protein
MAGLEESPATWRAGQSFGEEMRKANASCVSAMDYGSMTHASPSSAWSALECHYRPKLGSWVDQSRLEELDPIEPMTADQAATLKQLAEVAYDREAFKPNLTRAEADVRIAMLTAKLKLLGEPPHTL